MTSPAAGHADVHSRTTKRIVVDPPKDGAALVGKVLGGRYIVEAVIGKGGMGTVLRVRHSTLGRKFALKVLRREIVVDPPSVERFLQEAKIMASIRHPNLVEVTDFGELTRVDVPELGNFKQPFFVMELLEGETLADLLIRGGPLDARTAARIFKDVADALAAAHDKGVVHRDLKPDNIFLASTAAGRPTPKILDFGVAKLVGASKLTRAGVVFGTPYYMSPEQATGQTVDHRTDQYALGIVMYEALTGVVPFDDDTQMGVMTKHAFVTPEPITAVVKDPRRLGAIAPIVMRCLEKRPEARFADTRELAAILFDIGEGREASTPTPQAPVAMKLRDTAPATAVLAPTDLGEKRASWPIAAAACLAVIAMGLGALTYARRTSPTAADANASSAPPSVPASSSASTEGAPETAATATATASASASASATLPMQTSASAPTPTGIAVGSGSLAAKFPLAGGPNTAAAPTPTGPKTALPMPTATTTAKRSVDEVNRDLY